MAETEKLYAVGLTFTGELQKLLNRLREGFHQHMHYETVPHITIVYPFTPVVSIGKVIDKLAEITGKTKPFTMVLDGIGFFEVKSNVAYVDITNRQLVKDLHISLYRSLKGLITESFEFNLDMFVPHMTIGVDIPSDIFPDVKKRLAKVKIHYECLVNELALFSENERKWEQVQLFGLSG